MAAAAATRAEGCMLQLVWMKGARGPGLHVPDFQLFLIPTDQEDSFHISGIELEVTESREL